MTTAQLLQQDISKLLGIDDASSEEHETLMENIGSIILESVCLRLISEMDDVQKQELEALFENTDDQDAFIKMLEEKYPQVNTILAEEIAAFKEEAIAVMS